MVENFTQIGLAFDASIEPPNQVGRPTKRQQTNAKIAAGLSKMKPDVLQRLRDAFAVDATIAEACFYAGIAESTYYNWKKDNPEQMEEIERLRLTPILKARRTIANGLDTFQGATWFIERKRSDEFATKSKVDHGGKIETEAIGDSATIRAIANEYEEKMRAAIVEGRKKS